MARKEGCDAKHTKYNPTIEEFRCPKCNAEAGIFAVDEPATEQAAECEALHLKDYLHCYDCGFGTQGGRFVAGLLKKKRPMVECPTCKGHGMIERTPTEPSSP